MAVKSRSEITSLGREVRQRLGKEELPASDKKEETCFGNNYNQLLSRMNAPLPKNEAARLKALHQYQILDTTPEVAFDKLTQLAAQICETPVAIVSLLDEYRQWFKSKVGLDATETSRDVAFCAYTILQPDVLIVPDAQADCRFAANPLVTKDPHIRFYAGAPLTTPEGYALGTLCVIDKVPRTLKPEQVEALRVLSSQVSAQLELRLNLVNLFHVNSALRQSEEQFRLLFEKSIDAILVTDDNGNCLRANPAASILLGYSREQLLCMNVSDIYTTQPPGAVSCFNACNNASSATGEFSFQRADGLLRIIEHSACQLAPGQNLSILRDITSRKQAEKLLQKAHAELERRVEESQRRLAALIDSLPGIAFFCANTPEYPMTYLSEGCFTLTGYKSEELVGEKSYYKTITHPEDLLKVLNAIETAIALQQPYVVEYRICCKSGEEKWLWEKGNLVLNSNDQIVGMKGFISDITERKWTEEALRQAEEKYRGIFENAVEGIFQTDPQGFYISANSTLARIYGYNSPEELMKNLTNISQQLYVHSDQRAEFMHRMQKHDIVSNFESQVYRQDGSVIWISENARAIRNAKGTLLYYEGSVEDVTERKVAEEKLLYNAFHDSLTGLPNRALFMNRLGQVIQQVKRHQENLFAVLFLDLDRFKVINDSLGHLIGDRFLLAVATKLKACLRSTDTVARLGGDEFTILMEGLKDFSNVLHVAERIQEELALPIELDGHEVFTTTSIGIALGTTAYERPEDLLRDADTAMYRAKALGKARYEIFNADMYTAAMTRLQLETDLRRALDRQELRVYYQPIVSFTSGKISGFEALLRWQHPERGLVAPDNFIPLAEETGLIIPIGYWVLREACRQMQAWQMCNTNSLQKISVNLSVKQFSQPDLIERVTEILQKTGLDGCNLELEITESAIMENGASATATLLQLKNLGIRLSIDDFGTGYSSLGRLHNFPIDVLKIDRSFISQMGAEQGKLAITETIVTLAHKLGINVTAEGVETLKQLAQLRALKCEYGQGYFFSKPLDSEAAEALIVANPYW